MLTAVLTLLAIMSASLNLRAEYLGPQYQVYLFKPLTMVFIILIAMQARKPVSARYKYAIIVGLLFSLAGDIFLMLPTDLFIAGLVSFLIAHLIYIVAFRVDVRLRFSGRSLGSLAPFVIYGVIMFVVLAPYVGGMLVPVLVYMVAILVMAWQAEERWSQTRQRGALLAFIGAALFVISDSALAVNRFRGQYYAATALVLGTYFAAQWLIALSVGYGSGDEKWQESHESRSG